MVTLIPNPWFCTYPVYIALFGEGPRSSPPDSSPSSQTSSNLSAIAARLQLLSSSTT